MLSTFKYFSLKYCIIIFEQIMHSIANNNGLPGENTEYHEVFEVLKNLGMADLKQTFQEHCIQVNMYIPLI